MQHLQLHYKIFLMPLKDKIAWGLSYNNSSDVNVHLLAKLTQSLR